MKNLVLTLLGVMIGIYTIGICFSIYSLETRKNALEEHVSRVLQRTLEQEYRGMNKYQGHNQIQVRDEEQVRKDLKEELALDVGQNGQVEVEIGYLDLEKGIIHVVVQEHFLQFNGKERTIRCEKTAIVDAMENPVLSAGAAAVIGLEDESVRTSVSTETSANSMESSATNIYTNAYEYYQAYQGAMLFKPEDGTEAGVFYGTSAKESPTGKLVFETLGWRVTVKDNQGQIMDQVYYALDGRYINIADEQLIDGYRYKLYNISLNNLKNRLSEEANNALKKADCSIIFDACIVVKRDGVRSGVLTDNGIESGVVYTTYEGIVNAVNWSSKTKEALKNYFNKEIADMFFEVTLNCGTGIASVSGGGKYCYGTEITIDATPQRGYSFLQWIGSLTSSEKEYTFSVKQDITIQATTTRDDVAVNLYRNLDPMDTCVETIVFSFGSQLNALKDMGWEKPGYYQTGWSTSRIVAQPYFGVEEVVSEEWMERVTPSVDLYATWAPIPYVVNGVRFISGKYYKDEEGNWIAPEEGGLSLSSLWRMEEYSVILDEIFAEEIAPFERQ